MQDPQGLLFPPARQPHKFSKKDNIVISRHVPFSINHWSPFLVPQWTWMVSGPNASAGSIRHTACLLHTDSQIFDRYSAMKTCYLLTVRSKSILSKYHLWTNGCNFFLFYPKVKGVIFDPQYGGWNQYGHSTCGKQGEEFYPSPAGLNHWCISDNDNSLIGFNLAWWPKAQQHLTTATPNQALI